MEPYQENAIRLKDNHLSGTAQLCAPFFLVQEVANALWKAIKLRRILQEDAQEALQMLNDLKIDLQELDWHHTSQALSIACELDLAIYDAIYLFLADHTETRLVTADNQLYEKAKSHFKVLHIMDYL